MIRLDSYVKYYPLSHPQKGIWYTEKLYPGTSMGIVAANLKIKGDIDYTLLERAINVVIKKNDALRIRIVEENDECRQYIAPYEYKKLEYIDFSPSGIESLYSWDIRETQTPFRLTDSDLYRIVLFKIDDGTGGFFVKLHHTIGDAWSFILIANEITRYYRMLLKNEEIDDAGSPSYLEYLESESEYLNSDKFIRDRAFWNAKFATVPEIACIKTRKTNELSIRAKRKTFILPAKLCSKIRAYCVENKSSMLILFVAALALYINRVTDREDIVIGTPVLNRTNAREKNTVGMFINTVPVRVRVSGEDDFTAFIRDIAREWMSVLKHQKYSYDFLLKDLREKTKSLDRLFEIALSYQNAKFNKDGALKGQEGRWHFNGYQTESLYIHINDREDDGNIVIDYDFLTDLFHVKDIEFVHDHMIRLLWHALDNSQKKLPNIEMVSEREKNRILYEFNNTCAPYPGAKMLHEFFEEQAAENPGQWAAVFCGRSVTYDELNRKANQLARKLVKKGVRADCVVGILAYRSFEMLAAILAVLKAGGAYLPIDPGFPAERVRYLLEDSGARLLVSNIGNATEFEFKGEKLLFNFDGEADEDGENLGIANRPDSLAYVIYTSGSTGNPKGVMVEHRAVVNRLIWMQKKYPLDSSDTLLLKTPFTFDVSVWELMWWFFAGSRLAMLEPGDERKPDRVTDAIFTYRVTAIHFVPPMLNAFLDYTANIRDYYKLKSLKRVFASGEALSVQTVEKFNGTLYSRYGTTLHNLYGPTEAAIDVSYFDCSTGEKHRVIPIGKPIDNIRLLILDKHGNLLPIGATGELYISGDGLARGYLNRPELTGQRFLPNPFFPGERMYRTGDLVRWFPKGDIEYIGRADHQVKIRGQRIELEEIRLKILEVESVQDAVVVFQGADERKYLSAYIILKQKTDLAAIKNHLVRHLPGYMIPVFFVEIDEIPLTGNGKLNAAALPAPSAAAPSGKAPVAPGNALEKEILAAWKSELAIDNIGVEDNFFEAGGDSLAAIRLVSKLDKKLTVEDIYKYPTVGMLAEMLSARAGGSGEGGGVLVCLTEKAFESSLNVVCFPYGGGNSYVYKPLADAVCDRNYPVMVYSAKLPGHNPGSENEEFCDTDEMAVKLAEAINTTVKGEIVLYGHCVGSALTVETARRLEKIGRKINAVCIGASFPPLFSKVLNKPIDPWRIYSDRGIINFIRTIGMNEIGPSDEYLKPAVKAFRHDARSYYRYFSQSRIQKEQKLGAMIISIVGDDDPLTFNYKRRFKSWRDYSNNAQLYVLKNARHYFIKTHKYELAEFLQGLRVPEENFICNGK